MHTHLRNRHSRRSIGKLAGSLCVLAAVTLSGVSTVDANRGQPDKLVPIHGVMSGADETVPVFLDPNDRCGSFGEPYYLHYHGEGTAVVSHLGRVDFVVDHCTWIDNIDPLLAKEGYFEAGTMTATARNGDMLVMDEWGTFVMEFPYSYIDLHWTVNSELSTGRFAGATGSGTAAPIGDLANSTTSGSMTGMIAYDASNR